MSTATSATPVCRRTLNPLPPARFRAACTPIHALAPKDDLDAAAVPTVRAPLPGKPVIVGLTASGTSFCPYCNAEQARVRPLGRRGGLSDAIG